MFRTITLFCLTMFVCAVPAFSQKTKARPTVKPTPIKRVAFAAAQKLLEGETEGNLQRQISREIVTFTLTRLSSGQILELYYPVTPNATTKAKVTTVPGYGIWYESEAVYRESKRPQHALESVVPNTEAFIADVPQLVARLEKRLRTKLDYSRASLKRLDVLVARVQGVLTPTEIDPKLFQELLAYYGETLRRMLPYGEWNVTAEIYGKNYTFQVPGMRYLAKSVNQFKVLKPGESVINALYDEKVRGNSLTVAFDKDLAAAQ